MEYWMSVHQYNIVEWQGAEIPTRYATYSVTNNLIKSLVKIRIVIVSITEAIDLYRVIIFRVFSILSQLSTSSFYWRINNVWGVKKLSTYSGLKLSEQIKNKRLACLSYRRKIILKTMRELTDRNVNENITFSVYYIITIYCVCISVCMYAMSVRSNY